MFKVGSMHECCKFHYSVENRLTMMLCLPWMYLAFGYSFSNVAQIRWQQATGEHACSVQPVRVGSARMTSSSTRPAARC